MKINGGEAAYRVLRANGIDTVFGLLGGSMLELFDAIHGDDGMRYIGARDERAAAHMADAWTRISGRTGIVLGAQAGPGVANLVTGIIEAQLAYTPMVAIAGMISRDHQGRDTFQEIDQLALFKPICKQSIVVPKAERLPELLNDAIRLANSGRGGPVVLHVAHDIFAQTFDMTAVDPPSPVEGAAPTAAQIEQILNLLSEASAPVIFAGAGFKSRRGSAVLQALAGELNIPVVAATGHADIMPHDHALYAGQAGPRGNAVASGLTKNADLILALGNRLAFNSTFHSHDYVSATAKIVQVDIEARSIGRYFPVTLGIGKSSLSNERKAEATDSSLPLLPKRVLGEIRETLPRNAICTIDTGNACLQAADRLAHYQCPGLVTPLDFGLVGFAYAAALGSQAADAERPVIAVMGDGGFGFTMAEINSAVQHELPVIAIVIDNAAWGAEKAYQKEFFGGRLLGADIASPNYAEVAKLCGALGYTVDRPGGTVAALSDALAKKKPAVIHVKVDPDALNALRKDLFKSKKP
jgi:acetolactate synthase-1/2/3 large subunit/sulfoacetaldehyde acetyltransferase